VVKWLSEEDRMDVNDINLTDKSSFDNFLVNNRSPLALAAELSQPLIVELLLKARADPNPTGVSTTISGVPLWYAATACPSDSQWLTVKKLLDARADPEHQSRFGRSIYQHAVALGNKEIAKLLRDAMLNAMIKKCDSKLTIAELYTAMHGVPVDEGTAQPEHLESLEKAIGNATELGDLNNDQQEEVLQLLEKATSMRDSLRKIFQLGASSHAARALIAAIDAARDTTSSDDAATRVALLKSVINEHSKVLEVADAALLKEARALRDKLCARASTYTNTHTHASPHPHSLPLAHSQHQPHANTHLRPDPAAQRACRTRMQDKRTLIHVAATSRTA
jgi:hypothetical protein